MHRKPSGVVCQGISQSEGRFWLCRGRTVEDEIPERRPSWFPTFAPEIRREDGAREIFGSAAPRPDCLFGLDMAGGRDLRHFGLRHRADIQLLAQFTIDLAEGVPVLLEEAARILAALADALAAVAVPRARLFHQVVGHGQVQ